MSEEAKQAARERRAMAQRPTERTFTPPRDDFHPAHLPTMPESQEVVIDARYGLAMQALDPNQREFVRGIVQGQLSHALAARLAGFRGTDNELNVLGWKLSHDPRIVAAIREEGRAMVASYGPMALKVLFDVASNTQEKSEIRVKAATAILDRGGVPALTEVKIDQTVTNVETRADLERDIRVLAAQIGLDPIKLLGRTVTDAEFTVVREVPEPPLEANPPDDLSDIL